MDAKAKGWLRSGVTWVVTIAVTAVVVHQVDWGNLRETLSRANGWYLAAAVAVTVVGNLVVGPDRWRFILRRLGCRISLRRAVFIKIASSPVKFVVPMKMGEFFRAFYLHRQMGFSLERGLSSVLMEKVATMLAAGLFLLSGLALGGVRRWRWEALGVTGAFLLVFLLPGGRRFVAAALGRVRHGLGARFADILSALAELSSADKALILLYSLVFILTELVISYLSFRALGMRVPLVAFFVFTPLSILASIPTFSGIGTREGAAMLFFSAAGPFPIPGSTPADRFAGGALITLIYYVFVPIIGLPWSRRFMHDCIWKAPEVKSVHGTDRAG